MPSLDNKGKIAGAQIAFYALTAILTLLLVIRYSFNRDAGWFFLLIFSLTRLAGSALLIAGEMQTQATNLLTAAFIMEFAGILPLLFSSLGFIGMAGQHTYSENPRVATLLRLTGLLGLVGLGLCIAGGILGSPIDSANANTALLLRRAGVCVYAGVYVVLFIIHIGTWTYRWHLKSHRRHLLWGISVGLPFLGVRIAYAVLAAWSSSDLLGTTPSTNTILAKFNPFTGNWILYLIMSVVMEFVIVALYLFASTVLARRHY